MVVKVRHSFMAFLLASLSLLPAFASAGMTPEEVKLFNGHKAGAEKGDEVAQTLLATCYFYGLGVEKDLLQAVAWYHKAAEQGVDIAQFKLGLCYASGTGVAKDEVAAYAYWNLAQVTNRDALKNLAILERDLSADQIATGKKLSLELQLRIAAKKSGITATSVGKPGSPALVLSAGAVALVFFGLVLAALFRKT